MTELFLAQLSFAKALPLLLDKISNTDGVLHTMGQSGRCRDCKIGHPNSLHKKGLAQDINLFTEDGIYIQTTDAHEKFGIFWESLGGAWGGRFSDGNHYSWPYKGMR